MGGSSTESETLMKKFVLVLFGLGIIAAVVYLVATEGGRDRRDDLLARVRKGSEGIDGPEIDLREQGSDLAESASDLAEDATNRATTTVGTLNGR
jgi:hypothetical protein